MQILVNFSFAIAVGVIVWTFANRRIEVLKDSVLDLQERVHSLESRDFYRDENVQLLMKEYHKISDLEKKIKELEDKK